MEILLLIQAMRILTIPSVGREGELLVKQLRQNSQMELMLHQATRTKRVKSKWRRNVFLNELGEILLMVTQLTHLPKLVLLVQVLKEAINGLERLQHRLVKMFFSKNY